MAPDNLDLNQNVSKKKSNFNIYDYVFNLEEQVKNLQQEKQFVGARATSLELENQRLIAELKELKRPPFVIGSIKELVDDFAIIRSWNGNEFLVPVNEEHKESLKEGSRIAATQRSMNIVKILPEGTDSRIRAMEVIDRPNVDFSKIGGLDNIIQELEETVILPLTKPELFKKVGVKPPSGVLLHGLPGTGKTMLAKALANKTNATFIGVTGSELVRKFIGEGAGLVRDLFKLAEQKKPAVIFIDEIDALASIRTESNSGGDREVQRTLMQLLAELDGFRERSGISIIAATNRIDILDPAILRPGRFDRVLEVPLPNENERLNILKIHTSEMALNKDVSLKLVAEKTVDFSGADLKALCVEAGIFAIRENKKKISAYHFEKAVSKLVLDSEDESAPSRMFA